MFKGIRSLSLGKQQFIFTCSLVFEVYTLHTNKYVLEKQPLHSTWQKDKTAHPGIFFYWKTIQYKRFSVVSYSIWTVTFVGYDQHTNVSKNQAVFAGTQRARISVMYALFLPTSSCFILLSSAFTSSSLMVAAERDFAFSRKSWIRFSPTWKTGRFYNKDQKLLQSLGKYLNIYTPEVRVSWKLKCPVLGDCHYYIFWEFILFYWQGQIFTVSTFDNLVHFTVCNEFTFT